MRKVLSVAVIAAVAVAALAWYIYAHWSQFAVLDPAGPVGLAERSVMIATVALCAIVAVPVFVMLGWFIWRYRASNVDARGEHLPEWDHERAGEIICWFIPTAIIIVLSLLTWQSAHALDPYKPLAGGPALEVDVVALDWKWLFIYPQQGIASVNLLEIPQGTPVHFELTADAPMNSFWIPQLGGQIMVMPGMTTQLNLEASRTGTFEGFSANISGEGFAGMNFKTRAVSESDFGAWVASAKQAHNPLTASAYNALALPSAYNPVALYSSVENGLYTGVSMQYMMPGMSAP